LERRRDAEKAQDELRKISDVALAETCEGFYSYLKGVIGHGFEKRIMFGSDQMTWPDAIGMAVEAIEKADFISAEQKRDILYNNAARFLRLPPEQIARHHGASDK